MSSAVGGLSGPLHGGAPTRVLQMLDEVEASGDAEGYVRGLLDRGDRLMGFGHRVYRAEDPRARVLRRTADELGSPRFAVAEELERVALAELHARHPERVLATNVEFWSAVVLDIADIPGDLFPAMFACAQGRRLVGSHRRAEANRSADSAVGGLRRTGVEAARLGVTPAAVDLAETAARAASLTDERELSVLRHAADEELEAAARSDDFRVRAVAYRAVGQMRFRQKTELLARGLGDESPACRGSALLSLESLSRDHPGVANGVRSQLHQLANADPNQAVRRLAVLALKNGSPHADTIVLLEHIAASDDEERELRQTAEKVVEVLKKKARAAKQHR